MNDAAVELRGVTRTYGKGPQGVHEIDLRLEDGVSYGLVGRNGAGKSTLLRLVMGMLRPGAGTVRVFGRDPFREPETAKVDVGYLAEDQALPGMLTPQDAFALYRDVYPTWDDTFAGELVDRLELPLRRRIASLSKGESRQVALVCAVAHRPRLLVLDEPAGGLDPVVRREFLEAVVELLSVTGTTVVFSSHILQEVERVAGRLGVIDKGRLILEDDVDRLREGSCRALVETDGPVDVGSIPDCVRAARQNGAWALTLLCPLDEAPGRIADAIGGTVKQVRGLSLEDLFVDLVGSRR